MAKDADAPKSSANRAKMLDLNRSAYGEDQL
jgi:hypothetical protein